jgi:hypothetical protein
MSAGVAISEVTIEHLASMPDTDQDLDAKIQRLIEAEYRRELGRFSLMDRTFQKKYGMTFEMFEEQDVERQQGFSWEVESDAMAWETAVDGQRTVERKLRALLEAERGAD